MLSLSACPLIPLVPPSLPSHLHQTWSSTTSLVQLNSLPRCSAHPSTFLFGTYDRNCGLLFQKSALGRNRRPVTATASGLAATADLRYSCRKGGLRRPPLRAGDKTVARPAQTWQTVTSGGWRLDTDLLQPFLLFPWGDRIYTYFFFSTLSFFSLVSVIGSGQSIL